MTRKPGVVAFMVLDWVATKFNGERSFTLLRHGAWIRFADVTSSVQSVARGCSRYVLQKENLIADIIITPRTCDPGQYISLDIQQIEECA